MISASLFPKASFSGRPQMKMCTVDVESAAKNLMIYAHYRNVTSIKFKFLLSPSLLGLPRTLSTSPLMGFCPRARMTSPHWL